MESCILVLASHEATGTTGTSTVTATWHHLDPFITTLTIAGEEIETTPEHPFFVLLRGWVLAGDLRVGDSVRLRDGSYALVEATETRYDPASNLATLTYPNAVVSSFTYDPLGRLEDLHVHDPQQTLLEHYHYDHDGIGNRIRQTVGLSTTTYLVDELNPTGYAQVVEELVDGQVQARYTYGYDLISQQQVISGTWQTSYVNYDGLGSV